MAMDPARVDASVERWIASTLPLLAKEAAEEETRSAEASKGRGAWHGRCVEAEQGWAGHTTLTFQGPPGGRGGTKPSALLARGAPVVVGEGRVKGLVCSVSEAAVRISVDADEWLPEWLEGTAAVPVVPLRSDVTFRAMKYALRGGGMGYGNYAADAPPLQLWQKRSPAQRRIVELAFAGEEEGLGGGGAEGGVVEEILNPEGNEADGDGVADEDEPASRGEQEEEAEDDDDHGEGREFDWGGEVTDFYATLNESQQQAVSACLTSALPVHLILGPPGTGKTETVSELIRQTVRRGKRVLVAAPSNVAADNIVERLCVTGPKVGKLRCVRLGHAGRLADILQPYSLDARMAATDAAALGASAKVDMQKVQKKLKKTKARPERKALYAEIRALSRDMREMSKKMSKEVLRAANVVVGTLVNAVSHHIRREKFDLVIVDEAAQALEAATWMVIPKADRVVLAGDPYQLPPTVLTDHAELRTTLFERLFRKAGDRADGACEEEGPLYTMLTTQYRMNRVISDWSSAEFYQNRLAADSAVEGRLLTDLDGVEDADPVDGPAVVVDTSELGYVEDEDAAGSKVNHGEARRVCEYVEGMTALGVDVSSIAVITPYAAQRALLQSLLPDGVEVGTVDSYQGREKDAVIISLVRSNSAGEVGFLSDYRRLNVAVTRARRHVVLVGNATSLRRDAFLQRMFDYFEENGSVLME